MLLLCAHADVYCTVHDADMSQLCGAGGNIHASPRAAHPDPQEHSPLRTSCCRACRSRQQVRPIQTTAALLITNVINQVLPLVRYELADKLTFLKKPNPTPGTGRLSAPLQCRPDHVFTFTGGIDVCPHVFGSVLTRLPHICSDQVHQMLKGGRDCWANLPCLRCAGAGREGQSKQMSRRDAESVFVYSGGAWAHYMGEHPSAMHRPVLTNQDIRNLSLMGFRHPLQRSAKMWKVVHHR